MAPGGVHKKQASLIPLTHDYILSSEHEEAPSPEQLQAPHPSPPNVFLSRKPLGRSISPEPSPCNCNNPTTSPLRSASSGALGSSTHNDRAIDREITTLSSNGSTTKQSSKKFNRPASPLSSSTTPFTSFSVDGHRATVALNQQTQIFKINYTNVRGCCLPAVRTESIPYSEILSAEVLPPVITRWLWHPFAEKTYRLAIYTFRRSNTNPSHWFPRTIILSTPTDSIIHHFASALNTAAASYTSRPRHILVLVNPYGGAKKARKIYHRHVAPVFEKAGVHVTLEETQFGGHARSLLLDMKVEDVERLDGIVAVGGDGLFHEIVNGLLELRSCEDASESPGFILNEQQNAASTVEIQRRKAAAAGRLRVGHIPAGSTDAVACTLNGTRSAYSAAMRVALGDSVPLDVLRIDAADGKTEFATSMASYGFMGDLMVESESYRWMGPVRYEVVGAKMLAANRSYRARVSYLPAEQLQPGSFSIRCLQNCTVCMNGVVNGLTTLSGTSGTSSTGSGSSLTTSLLPTIAGSNHNHHSQPTSPAPSSSLQKGSSFARHSRHSLSHRQQDWITVEDDFAGIMLVIMPCRSDKSLQGVAKYGHLSDGNIHLVLVRRCSRLQYLKFLLHMSNKGLEPGKHGYGDFIQVIPATAVRVEPGIPESTWNIDGELLRCGGITAETHRGAIDVFSRGVEDAGEEGFLNWGW